LDAALAAVRGSVYAVLERYKSSRSGQAPIPSHEEFAADVLAQSSRALGAALGRSREEAEAILEVTGAFRDMRSWLTRRGEKTLAQFRKQDQGGLDRLERQGSWSSLLHGLSWLIYALMFFTGTVSSSAGLLFLSALLAAPEIVVWASLLTRVVAGSYPESQGRIYSAINLYQMLCGIVGLLLYGWLMNSSTEWAPSFPLLPFWATGALLIVCALIDFVAPRLIFPIGPKRAR
ncbi:MAG: hypothetical protein AAB036_09090, partial [Elusimicrobiota bacterium]